MSDYNEVKDNLTGIIMSATQGVCPTDVDDISDALSLIEQQAAEIDELKAHVKRLREVLKSILGWRELRNISAIPIDRIEEVARMALEATPQQSLAERDAEVAMAAIRTALRNLGEPTLTESTIQIFSYEYAQRIKEGDQRP